jgi:hypothetical protein
MHVLFGDRMPANFRDLVSRTNPGLTGKQLILWLTAYAGRNQGEFIKVLNYINNASFPRVSMGSMGSTVSTGSMGSMGSMGSAGGRRRCMTKRKTIRMRKTRKINRK